MRDHDQVGCLGEWARNFMLVVLLDASEQLMMKPARIVHRQIWRESGLSLGSRSIPEETAVALTYNGGTYAAMMTRLGRERGWPGMTREQFEASTALRGHLAEPAANHRQDPLPAWDIRP